MGVRGRLRSLKYCPSRASAEEYSRWKWRARTLFPVASFGGKDTYIAAASSVGSSFVLCLVRYSPLTKMATFAEEKDHTSQGHKEYASDNEKQDIEAATPTFGVDAADAPWTATRCIAVASLCMVYVGSQIVLYFVSSALTNISESIGTKYGNWMLTGMHTCVAGNDRLLRSLSKHSWSCCDMSIRRLYHRSAGETVALSARFRAAHRCERCSGYRA